MQILEFDANENYVFSAVKRHLLGSDVVEVAVSVTQATNDPSRWSASFSTNASGIYKLDAFVGGNSGYARPTYKLTGAAGTFHPLEDDPSQALTLPSGTVTAATMVSTGGKIQRPITIGDDYLAANSRTFSWTVDAVAGFTLGSVSVAWGGLMRHGGNCYRFAGTGAVTEVDGRWRIDCELPQSATEGLPAGLYDFSVELSVDGVEITRVQNLTEGDRVRLIEKQT